MLSPAAVQPQRAIAQDRHAAQQAAGSWAALWLVAIGAVMALAIWWGLVAPYRLDQYYRLLTPYPQDLAKISRATAESAYAWALAWAVLFAGLLLALRRAPARPTWSWWAALGLFATLFNSLLLYMFPVGAADLFDQIVRGRTLAIYGQNPFTTSPAVLADDPLRPWVGMWAGTTSPYGPLWELPAAAAAWLGNWLGTRGGDVLWASLLTFKGLVILAYIIAGALLIATLGRLAPQWQARGALLFLWNPLILFETAGNGHNDIVMIAWLLAAMYLLAHSPRAALLAPAALAGAALVKFIPILLLLPTLAFLWYDAPPATVRRLTHEAQRIVHFTQHVTPTARLTRITLALALAAGLGMVAYAPFWAGPQVIGALARNDLFTASIPKVAADWLAARWGGGSAAAAWAGEAVRGVALGLVGGWTLVQTLGVCWAGADGRPRPARLRGLYRACYEIFFVYLMFATLWFQPWYLQWLLALAPLTLDSTRVGRALLFAAGGVGNYFVWDWFWLWNRVPDRLVHQAAALVVNTPALLYTLLTALAPPEVRDKR